MSLSPSSASPNPTDNNNDTTTTSKRARLEAFYQKYAPREMYKVDHAMKLSMPEEELFQALRERYNVPSSSSPTTATIEKSAETQRPSSSENNRTAAAAASYNANLLQQSHHQAQSSSSLASSTSTLRPQQQQQQPSASIIAALQQQQKEEFVYPNNTVVVPPGSSPARNMHFDHHSHSSHNHHNHHLHHRHSTYSATASMMNQQQDVFHDNNYNDDDNHYDEEHQYFSPDSPRVRSDAALRHDVLKVLIATQRAEAENRTRMLERKTFLTRYCTILLRWMEFTTHKISRREKEMMSKKGSNSNNNQNEDSSTKEETAILRTGISPTRTTPRNTAAGVTSTSPSSQLKPTDEVPFTAVPHGTLHTLRRQWQQRVASILQRRSFFILQQRSLDKWRLFATKMGGNKQAYQAIASSESALLVSKRKRRQVILNSVEMQRTRAMRTLGSSFFFKWRLATSQKVNSVKRVELLQKEAQAKALILAEKELRRRQSEDEEHQSKLNQPPQSLESLVQALTGPNIANNNNNSKNKNDDQSSGSSSHTNNNTVAIRPAFFHPPDSNLDFSPPRTLNAASEIQMKETSRTLKIQLTRIRSEMTKMKSEIRQASNYIATECSQWEMKFKKKFGSGSTSNSNREIDITTDDSKQKRVDSSSTASAPPPTWQYERSILQRRAAAYDALLEDHRLLQESLQAAEEDIARLRSLALLREMHSSPQAALVHAGNNHNHNNLSTSSRSASASGGVMMDRLGLSTTPRITMNPPIAALPVSVGRDRYDYNQQHHHSTQQQQRSFSAVNTTPSGTNNQHNTTTESSVSRRFAANYHHRDPHQPQVNSPGHAQVPPENLGVSCFTL